MPSDKKTGEAFGAAVVNGPRAAEPVSRPSPGSPVLVGVGAALETIATPFGETEAIFVARPYLTHIVRAGGLPVVLSPVDPAAGEVGTLLGLVDALLLVGGRDIDPARYGSSRHGATETPCPERDEFELALTRRAVGGDLPVLGICRGMQLINVALGGTLHQHLPEVLGHARHHCADPDDRYAVRLAAGSLAARAVGATAVAATHSQHHQGVARLGQGLVASGWSDDDLPLTVEHVDRRFVLGVQWHPEVDARSRVIAALVAAAGARAGVAVR